MFKRYKLWKQRLRNSSARTFKDAVFYALFEWMHDHYVRSTIRRWEQDSRKPLDFISVFNRIRLDVYNEDEPRQPLTLMKYVGLGR